MNSIANQRKDANLKKTEIIQILTTEKINKMSLKVNGRTKLERYKLECEENGHNVNNCSFDFDRIHYIT